MTRISTTNELKRLAWKVGVVYFQVYQDQPSEAFYKHLKTLLPYERIEEIRAESAPKLQSELGFSGTVPFFGAVTNGWIIGVTDNPDEITDIVVAARKFVVLPEAGARKNSSDENIKLECLDDL